MQLQDPEEPRATGIAVFYYVFDLLHVDGYDVDALRLRARKRLLRRAFDLRKPIRACIHRNEDGEGFYREAAARDGRD